MGYESKREYLARIRSRYLKANRRYKKLILDEFCAVWGDHRKHAIRLLNQKQDESSGNRGRPSKYGVEERKVLEKIWLTGNRPCSRRLKTMIPIWLPAYEKRYGNVGPVVREKLHAISKNSIDRLLKPTRKKYGTHGRCSTRPGTQLLDKIPIKTTHWDISEPGYMQADTVAHGGSSMQGDFVFSLTFTDIYSEWTENRAVWNKGAYGVMQQLEDLEDTLPFIIKGFHSDNGNEFLNHHLYRYYKKRNPPVDVTRGRPRRGNDQAHVEQKNWSHVRLLLGCQRIDNPDLIEPINDLYREWALFNNFFCTNLKLTGKTRVGSRYKKTYDVPKTPHQRLMASEYVTEPQKTYLTEMYCSLNPFSLKRNIDRKQQKILNLLR